MPLKPRVCIWLIAIVLAAFAGPSPSSARLYLYTDGTGDGLPDTPTHVPGGCGYREHDCGPHPFDIWLDSEDLFFTYFWFGVEWSNQHQYIPGSATVAKGFVLDSLNTTSAPLGLRVYGHGERRSGIVKVGTVWLRVGAFGYYTYVRPAIYDGSDYFSLIGSPDYYFIFTDREGSHGCAICDFPSTPCWCPGTETESESWGRIKSLFR